MSEMTPNQLVAWNLREARKRKGWTQEEAAERLEPYLGERWSRTTFSAAEEGTISGRRIRQFTADDLVALARCFELPVLWFLMPPAEKRALIQVGAEEHHLPEDYLDWLLSPDYSAAQEQRIRRVVSNLHPSVLRELLERLDAPKARLIREVLNAHVLNVRELADSLNRTASDVQEALSELGQEHGIEGQYQAERITDFVMDMTPQIKERLGITDDDEEESKGQEEAR